MLYFSVESFPSKVTELFLVFSSNSVESISGLINSTGKMKGSAALILTAFQMIVFPFDSAEMIFAHRKIFSGWEGYFISVLGRVIGSMICYDLGYTFFFGIINRIREKCDSIIDENKSRKDYKRALFLRILPINYSFSSYLSGGAGIRLKEYIIVSTGWAGVVTGFYFLKSGYFSYSTEQIVFLIRLGINISCIIFLFFE